MPEVADSDLLLLLSPPLSHLRHSLRFPYDLLKFQPAGVEFLTRSRQALLGDEMGLGKTVQAATAMRILFLSGAVSHALVVCPASLKRNWVRELKLWAPELSVQMVDGLAWQRSRQWRRPVDVMVANYEAVRNDQEHIASRHYGIVVCDEAQRLKNPRAKLTQATRDLLRDRSWCLTGTPLENDINDFLSVICFLDSDTAQSAYTAYTWDRVKPIVDTWMSQHFLRRRKADVLTDLPPKRHTDLELGLSHAQQKAYDRALRDGRLRLGELGGEITIQHVLALLTRLKQICNFDPLTGDSAKLSALRELLGEATDSGQKTLVFSQFRATVLFLGDRLEEFRPLCFHGQLSTSQRNQVVERFQRSKDDRVLLMTLKSGGVGLNLSAASQVVHFDRWWNPAVEKQAEDRAHRIGQTRGVLVTRLITLGTIEERISAILMRKQELFDEVIEGGAQAETAALTTDELFGLVDLVAPPKSTPGRARTRSASRLTSQPP